MTIEVPLSLFKKAFRPQLCALRLALRKKSCCQLHSSLFCLRRSSSSGSIECTERSSSKEERAPGVLVERNSTQNEPKTTA